MRANLAIAITRMVLKPNANATDDKSELFALQSSFCEQKLENDQSNNSSRSISLSRASTISEHYTLYSVSIQYK